MDAVIVNETKKILGFPFTKTLRGYHFQDQNVRYYSYTTKKSRIPEQF